MRSPSPAALARLIGLSLLCGAALGCAKKKPPPPPPPTVTVAAPLKANMVDWDDYEGQFVAVDAVDVRPRVTGYLTRIAFRDGDKVAKGQVLFQIDPRPYQAALDQAKGAEAHDQAALTNAEEQLARGRVLVGAHAISQQAFELLQATERQAAADLLTGQANVRANALNVAFTRVTAPVAGRVSDRRLAVGNLVTADTTILTNIESLDPIRFQFTGSEALYLKYQRQNLAGVRPSSRYAPTPVEVQLQDEPTYRWKGRMDFVDNVIDPSSGAIRARAVIDNPQDFLTPGMFGHLRLVGSGVYEGLLIPDAAISSDLNQQVVEVVGRDGKVAQRVVTPGPVYRDLRVIRAGLRPDDLVIVDGADRAKVGQKVTVRRGEIKPATAGPEQGAAGYVNPTPTGTAPAADVPRTR